MKNSTIALILGISVLSAISCNPSSKTLEKEQNQSLNNNRKDTLEFKTVKNYFILSSATQPIPEKVTTQEDFDKYFGMATIMSENEKPTPIDFSKEFVIIVAYPETKKETEIIPLSLEKNDSELFFNYKVNIGRDLGFTIRPFAMIIVNKAADGNLKLKRINKVSNLDY